MTTVHPSAVHPTASVRPTGGCPSGSGMSGSMKTSGDAAATMFEHASVVSAKIAVIDDRHAVRDVGAVIEEHRASAPGWRPCAETPPEAGVDTNRNSRVKGKAGSPNDTGRRGQHNEARIGDKQRP